MLFMVLYQVSDDYIGVYQPSLCAHRILARSRAAFAAASRISPKLILFPFLLASAPFSDRVPGCTRIVAWSPSTAYWSLSPGLICSAWRIFPGIVVCPFLVTVEWGMNCSLPLIYSLHLYYALPGHSLAKESRGIDGKFPPLSKSPIITAKRHPRFVEARLQPGSFSRHSPLPRSPLLKLLMSASSLILPSGFISTLQP